MKKRKKYILNQNHFKLRQAFSKTFSSGHQVELLHGQFRGSPDFGMMTQNVQSWHPNVMGEPLTADPLLQGGPTQIQSPSGLHLYPHQTWSVVIYSQWSKNFSWQRYCIGQGPCLLTEVRTWPQSPNQGGYVTVTTDQRGYVTTHTTGQEPSGAVQGAGEVHLLHWLDTLTHKILTPKVPYGRDGSGYEKP